MTTDFFCSGSSCHRHRELGEYTRAPRGRGYQWLLKSEVSSSFVRACRCLLCDIGLWKSWLASGYHALNLHCFLGKWTVALLFSSYCERMWSITEVLEHTIYPILLIVLRQSKYHFLKRRNIGEHCSLLVGPINRVTTASYASKRYCIFLSTRCLDYIS